MHDAEWTRSPAMISYRKKSQSFYLRMRQGDQWLEGLSEGLHTYALSRPAPLALLLLRPHLQREEVGLFPIAGLSIASFERYNLHPWRQRIHRRSLPRRRTSGAGVPRENKQLFARSAQSYQCCLDRLLVEFEKTMMIYERENAVNHWQIPRYPHV